MQHRDIVYGRLQYTGLEILHYIDHRMSWMSWGHFKSSFKIFCSLSIFSHQLHKIIKPWGYCIWLFEWPLNYLLHWSPDNFQYEEIVYDGVKYFVLYVLYLLDHMILFNMKTLYMVFYHILFFKSFIIFFAIPHTQYVILCQVWTLPSLAWYWLIITILDVQNIMTAQMVY